MRVAVNSHALPVYKKNRIASLLCIFETTIHLHISCPIKTTVGQYFYRDTVLPAKSDSDFMICLQSYQGLIINRSLVY